MRPGTEINTMSKPIVRMSPWLPRVPTSVFAATANAKRLAALACLCAVACVASRAQTLTTLANFPATYSPIGLLTQATDGNFYASSAGEFFVPCSIFKITPAGALSTLVDFGTGFSGTGVVQAGDGNFFTALLTTSAAAIYQVSPGGTATMIHQFASDQSEGFNPSPLILGQDGNLYGTTALGGPGGLGTFYKVTLSGQLTVLYGFSPTGGIGPSPLVQGRDGNFYGVSSSSGTDTIYRLTPAGVLTTVTTFPTATGGGLSSGPLIQGADGAFYGTTQTAGANNAGTIFKFTLGGAFTVLYTFPAASGAKSGLVQAPDGSFYGTAYGGSDVHGSVYQLGSSGTLTTIHTFTGSDGSAPEGLILGKDGNLYGLTGNGGANGSGIAYKVAPGGSSQPVSINQGGVVTASAFGEFASAAPGTWIEIYGTNLASDTRSWLLSDFTGNDAPTSLDGTYVTIGGQRAYVDFISPTQVNALIPSNVPTGTQQVTVTSPAGTTAPYNLTINAEALGLLAPANFKIGGTQYVVALFADNSYALPTGAISGLTSRPAKPGDIIVLYGVGFGPVTPSISAGQLVQQSNSLASDFHIFIGGMECQVQYDGLAPDYTGLYQFNIVVPAVAAGNAALTFTLNGTSGTQTLYIAVGQ